MAKQLNDIEKEVLEWNSKFPVDKWWRDKHEIAFMSKKHKAISFLEQIFEFYEEMMILESKVKQEEYIPNVGDFLSQQNLDEKSEIQSIKEQFESEFGDMING